MARHVRSAWDAIIIRLLLVAAAEREGRKEGKGRAEMVNTFFVFCACIDQASVGVVEQWGRFLRLAGPGLNFFNPFAGQCLAGVLSTRISSLDVRVETKTKVPLASVYKGEAEKVLMVKKAEAEAEAKYLSGVGVAKQRQAITDGLRENIVNFSNTVSGTSAKEVMDLIMVTQYFDTIKELGNSSKNTTVFIPHGPGHVRDVTDQIRNGMMEASSNLVGN
ncbi:hypothetical protein BHE74_00013969 [Ensete ventricosum]|uniref:Uncharacterized protein n=1 Tax=Ensete ventricosum TaxID=4639 RepID=A0A444G675_ENSVE|nr:hypothetical protein GW17_00005029 [Ensete ventricosum]RWW77832.1 hypothetical protein BHE74_00013969 [Ensete ventricosum]RZR72504.1 hypothetical protein BHM03_00014094 [Ensete ventricosum]